LVCAIAISGCSSLPAEPLEEGPDIRFPDLNRGQLKLHIRRLERTEQIFFEGQRLDFLGSPWERDFLLNVNLHGEFSLEVRQSGKRCNQMKFPYSEEAPIDSLKLVVGCSRIERFQP
jgi:hypothetical protein